VISKIRVASTRDQPTKMEPVPRKSATYSFKSTLARLTSIGCNKQMIGYERAYRNNGELSVASDFDSLHSGMFSIPFGQGTPGKSPDLRFGLSVTYMKHSIRSPKLEIKMQICQMTGYSWAIHKGG
jgi:hypothetical protein